MSGFIDIYLPVGVPGYPCISVPRTKTTIQVSSSGKERRNQEWAHPLHRFILPEGVRQWSVVQDLGKMWKITAGPAYSFAFSDPLDFASCDLAKPNLEPVVDMEDQLIGTADGFTDTFQLVKTYSVGGNIYDRNIHLPVLDSVLIARDGVLIDDDNYTVTRPGGKVQFDVPPGLGGAGLITAGFLFDCEVRFESDETLEGILRTYQVGGFADINLTEVRPC